MMETWWVDYCAVAVHFVQLAVNEEFQPVYSDSVSKTFLSFHDVVESFSTVAHCLGALDPDSIVGVL